MSGVLLICQTGPMGAVDEENSHWKSFNRVNHRFGGREEASKELTITQNELSNPSNVHRKGTEEVVIAAESD
jgi:hypothetical protein